MLSAMVAFALSGAERWIIVAYTDLDTLGIYAIAAKFALGVGILIQPFHMWWMPKRFQVQQSKGGTSRCSDDRTRHLITHRYRRRPDLGKPAVHRLHTALSLSRCQPNGQYDNIDHVV
ncbi:hypothetical protein QW180_19040 [Vibrio sinaloensis]|nr:hypothetical protein [Vibrio sinaloensis]